MTTLTPLRLDAGPGNDTILAPVPWRRMAWVIWRQHRAALIAAGVVAGALGVYLWVTGLHLHHAYAVATACRPTSSIACGNLANTFDGINGFLTNGFILQAIPPLIGAFVGAPILAREIESGTFRFAWTQGFGRLRWTLAKLVTLGVLVTAAAGAFTVLTSWYYSPYFATADRAASLSQQLPIAASSPFAPGLFDLRGVTFAAWTLAAFAIGVLAGILLRRVVPAIAVTLAAYAALAFTTGGFLREHYLAPLVTTTLSPPSSAWVLNQWWTKGGHPVSQTEIDRVLLQGGGKVFGKGGVPKSLDTAHYLAQHGYAQLTSYQPLSRFWPFQWIEGGWLLALSLLLVVITIWLVRRRAS